MSDKFSFFSRVVRVSGAMRRFRQQSGGAVSVEFVMLIAAVVALGLTVLASLQEGGRQIADRIEVELRDDGAESGERPPPWGGVKPEPLPPETPEDPVRDPDDDADGSEPETPGDSPPEDAENPDPGGDGPDGGDGGDGGQGGDGPGDEGGNDNPGDGGDGGNGGSGGGSGGGGSGGNGDGGAGDGPADDGPEAPVEPDFILPGLELGYYWSDRVVSSWMSDNQLGLRRAEQFRVWGDGNPDAQDINGNRATEGRMRWGTNIHVDTPPPGGAHAVFLEIGGRIGSFTVSRAAAP